MQLERIALGGREPGAKSLFEPRLRRRGNGAEKGLDREVVTHRVAFHQTPHSADVPALALGLRPDDGKSHLAAPDRTQIDLHRQPPRQAEGVGIRKMDECLAATHRNCLQHDAIVARAERPLVCVQPDLQIVRGPGRDTIGKRHPIGLIERLVVLLADTDVQDAPLSAGGSAAILGIEMQAQDFAPVAGTVQCGSGRGKRLIDERVHIARHAIPGLAGSQKNGLLVLIVAELIAQFSVFGA